MPTRPGQYWRVFSESVVGLVFRLSDCSMMASWSLGPHKGPVLRPMFNLSKLSSNTYNKQSESDFASFYLQLTCIIKGTGKSVIVPQRLRNSDAFQRTAICKGIGPNGSHWLRDCDASQRLAICKGKASNGRHRLWNSDVCQRTAVSKGKVSNDRHRLRDCDACQRTAPKKGTVLNGGHRLRDTNACQSTAPTKGTVANGPHRIRDSDARQRSAIVKGTILNGKSPTQG